MLGRSVTWLRLFLKSFILVIRVAWGELLGGVRWSTVFIYFVEEFFDECFE